VPPPQKTNAQQEQHVIASPNPTVDDSKTTVVEPGKISGTQVQPATNTTNTPLKKKASRSRHKRKRPRTD
jgi:hypothetical protein